MGKPFQGHCWSSHDGCLICSRCWIDDRGCGKKMRTYLWSMVVPLATLWSLQNGLFKTCLLIPSGSHCKYQAASIVLPLAEMVVADLLRYNVPPVVIAAVLLTLWHGKLCTTQDLLVEIGLWHVFPKIWYILFTVYSILFVWNLAFVHHMDKILHLRCPKILLFFFFFFN